MEMEIECNEEMILAIGWLTTTICTGQVTCPTHRDGFSRVRGWDVRWGGGGWWWNKMTVRGEGPNIYS